MLPTNDKKSDNHLCFKANEQDLKNWFIVVAYFLFEIAVESYR